MLLTLLVFSLSLGFWPVKFSHGAEPCQITINQQINETGDLLMLDLLISGNPGIASLEYVVSYEPTLIQPLENIPGKLLEPGMYMANPTHAINNQTAVHAIWVSPMVISGDGPLCRMNFRIIETGRYAYGLEKLVITNGEGALLPIEILRASSQTDQSAKKISTSRSTGPTIPETAGQGSSSYSTGLDSLPGVIDQSEGNPFKDLTGHWAQNEIRNLTAQGVLSGYPDGSFYPDNKVTRAEMAVILDRFLNLEEATGNNLQFTDAQVIPAWATDSVSSTLKAGLIKGYSQTDGTMSFRAHHPLSRAELAVIIDRIDKVLGETSLASLNSDSGASTQTSLSPDLASSYEQDNDNDVVFFQDSQTLPSWASLAISRAATRGIITGYPDQTFRPANFVTRAEVASILARVSIDIKQ